MPTIGASLRKIGLLLMLTSGHTEDDGSLRKNIY